MLAIGMLTRYSGSTRPWDWRLRAPAISIRFRNPAWLAGVALTGSDTSSNVLFGSLQKISAQQVNVSPVLMAAANTTGGVYGQDD